MPTTYSYKLRKLDGGINEDGSRFYTRTYQVVSSVVNDEPDNIDDVVPLNYYTSYPTDSAALLKRKRVQQTDDLNVWVLVLEYDSRPLQVDRGTTEAGQPGSAPSVPGGNSNQVAPNLRPWVVKWGSVQTEEPLERDRSVGEDLPEGAPVVNRAGVKFDPPIMVRAAHATVSITAYRLQAQVEKVRQFINHVNKKEFLGHSAGEALCTAYQITSVYEAGAFYWQVDVTVEFKRPAWNPIVVLNAGTVQKVGSQASGFSYRACIDSLGNPVSQPVPLASDGTQLAIGGTVNYLEFTGYYEADFSQLI